MKKSTLIGLLLFGLYDASGQSSNRMKAIELILKPRKPKREQIDYHMEQGIYAVIVKTDATAKFVSFCDPIPKFQLPHGAIVCRFEEYVQMHSPFKLNIGVGGE